MLPRRGGIWWHLWEIDLIFAPGLPPGWFPQPRRSVHVLELCSVLSSKRVAFRVEGLPPHQPSRQDQIDPSHLFKVDFCSRLQDQLVPFRRIRLAVKVNPTSANRRFGLDVRAGGQTPEVNCLDRFKVREIPCRVKAARLLSIFKPFFLITLN